MATIGAGSGPSVLPQMKELVELLKTAKAEDEEQRDALERIVDQLSQMTGIRLPPGQRLH